MHPLQMKYRRTTIYVMVALIWLVSFVMASPITYFSEVHSFNHESKTYNICVIHWPDGVQHLSHLDY